MRNPSCIPSPEEVAADLAKIRADEPYAAQRLYTALYRIVRQSLSPHPIGHDAIVEARAALNAAEKVGIGKSGLTDAAFKAFYRRTKKAAKAAAGKVCDEIGRGEI